jgi:hypothetical protein
LGLECPTSLTNVARAGRNYTRSEARLIRKEGDVSEGTRGEEARKGAVTALLANVSCIVGLLLDAGGILFALFGASANVSAGAVGAALGILGYFLGAKRLGAATIVLGVIAVLFMAAAATGLIPGIGPFGHGYD